jgi:hypothetical protein
MATRRTITFDNATPLTNGQLLSVVDAPLGLVGGIAAPSGGGGGGVTAPGCVYVDSVHGNDSTAVVGDPAHPYLTAQAAWNNGSGAYTLVLLPIDPGLHYTLSIGGNVSLKYTALIPGTASISVVHTGAGTITITDLSNSSVDLLLNVQGGATGVYFYLLNVKLVSASLYGFVGSTGTSGSPGVNGADGADDNNGSDSTSGGGDGSAGGSGGDGGTITQIGGLITGALYLDGGGGGHGGNGGVGGNGGNGGALLSNPFTNGGNGTSGGNAGVGGAGGNAGTLNLSGVLCEAFSLSAQQGPGGIAGTAGVGGTGGSNQGGGSDGTPGGNGIPSSDGNAGTAGAATIWGSRVFSSSFTAVTPSFAGTQVDSTFQT